MANAGHKLNEALLKDIENTFALSTIFEWYRTLVGDKYNRTERGKKKGRKPVSDELRDLILKIAKENTSWGYRRIASYIHYLGYDITFITVKRVLDNVGIVPPEDGRKTNHFWQKFSDARKNVIAACDFATYKIVIPKGLIRESILFFEDITTREVWLGGISAQADGPWTAQIARNQVDSETGPLRNMKYLIHDCDVLYTKDFVSILESTGPTSKRTPPRPPQLNGHVESFIKTFKTECLDHLVLTSEAQLRHVVREFLLYYNHKRPHSGLGGRMIKPWPQDEDGEIVKFSRLGGLLNSPKGKKGGLAIRGGSKNRAGSALRRFLA